jgi:hypothetical protein
MVPMNTPAANLPDDDELVPSAPTKREFGIGSDMTLWRWSHDPRIKFPQPDIVINGRKYWKRGTLRRFRQRLESMPKEITKTAARLVAGS